MHRIVLLIAAIAVAMTFVPRDASAQSIEEVCADRGTVGTDDHFIACMTAHFFNSKKARSGFPILPENTWNCMDLIGTYADRTGGKTRIKVDCRALARLVSRLVPESPPDWAACTGYEPNNPAHVTACLERRVRTGQLLDSGNNTCSMWQHFYRLDVAYNNEHVLAGDGGFDPRLTRSRALIFPERRIPYVAPPCASFQAAIDGMQSRVLSNPLALLRNFAAVVAGLPTVISTIALLGLSGVFAAFGFLLLWRSWSRDHQRAPELVREKVRVRHSPATIAGVSNWSETHVRGSSSGGGGYIGPYGGTVSAPSVSVSSTVKNKHQFFLVYGNGHEVPITITDLDFPTRDGQVVDTVSLSCADSNPIVLVYVRATRKHLTYHGYIADIARMIWPSQVKLYLYVLLLASAAAIPVAGIVGNVWIVPVIGIGATVAARFLTQKVRELTAKRILMDAVTELLAQFKAAPAPTPASSAGG